MEKPLYLKRILSRYKEIIPDSEFFTKVILQKPIRCIRVNFLKIDTYSLFELLNSLGFNLIKIDWLNYAFYTHDENPGKTIYHSLGYYYVEDIVSLLPPIILFRSLNCKRLILDLAAAPGGKCTHIAQLLLEEEPSSIVIANEPNSLRRRALIINVDRLTLPNIIITGYDGRYFPKNVLFNGIIFDAPCSSEALLYEMKGNDLKMLSRKIYNRYSQLQKAIIKSAYEIMNNDSLLIYSVCTFAPEEAENVVNYALEIGFKIEKLPKLPLKTYKGVDEWKIDRKWVYFDPQVSKFTARVYPHLNYSKYKGSTGYLYLALLKKV